MKYTYKYNKLDKPLYTTIRRYKKGEIGDIVREAYPNGYHNSKIVGAVRLELGEIPTEVLKDDADVESRKEFLALINQFYRTPITEATKVYLYILMNWDEDYDE